VHSFAFRASFTLQLVSTAINLAVALSGSIFRNATSLNLVLAATLVAIGAGVVASLGGVRVWPSLLTAIGGPLLVMGVLQLTFSLDGDPLDCGGAGPFTRATTFLPMADWCVGADGGVALAGGRDEVVGDTLGGLVILGMVIAGCVAAVTSQPRRGVAQVA
jgi:hypothetical protein